MTIDFLKIDFILAFPVLTFQLFISESQVQPNHIDNQSCIHFI